MAENVQRRLEESIPELQEMDRTGMFTEDEIRNVIKRRKEFEYKLTKRRKPKEDYQRYIQYEIGLLSLVKLRRKRIGNEFKKEEIDYSICRRIARIFKESLIRYRSDSDLWLTYLDFCKSVFWKAQATRVINSMLKVHSNKPDLWITGALFEYNTNNSPDTARRLMLRGLNFNPDSKKLYLEYFMLELMFVQQKKEEKESLKTERNLEEVNVEDEILQGKLASIVFRKAAEKIPDPEFLGSFISACQSFSADEIEQEVIEHLKENFAGSEITWKILATQKLLLKEEDEDKPEKVQQCLGVFEEAVKTINTSKMWSYYIDFALEILALAKKKADKIMAIERIQEIFTRASDVDGFNCEHYSTWAKFATKLGNTEEAGSILEKGIKNYPQSEILWLKYYHWAKKNSSGSSVSNILERAVKNVPDDQSITLWRLGLKAFSKDPLKLQGWINEAMKLKPSVAKPIKLEFLEREAKNKGLNGARAVFKKLSVVPPISRQFFSTMVHVEKDNASDVGELRKIYDMAVVLFGETDVDLWLEYMDVEQNYPGGKHEKVGQLHWQAVKQLRSDLTDEFITRALQIRMAS